MHEQKEEPELKRELSPDLSLMQPIGQFLMQPQYLFRVREQNDSTKSCKGISIRGLLMEEEPYSFSKNSKNFFIFLCRHFWHLCVLSTSSLGTGVTLLSPGALCLTTWNLLHVFPRESSQPLWKPLPAAARPETEFISTQLSVVAAGTTTELWDVARHLGNRDDLTASAHLRRTGKYSCADRRGPCRLLRALNA